MAGGRFDYIKYDDISRQRQQHFKDIFEMLETAVDAVLPESREKSLVMTHLEIAYLWAGKAIRNEQIAERGPVIEEPTRSNS